MYTCSYSTSITDKLMHAGRDTGMHASIMTGSHLEAIYYPLVDE